MPRRGWSAMEIPSGWFEVIRGPRPPSVRWPQAHDRQPRGQLFEGKRERRSGPVVRLQSRPNGSAQSAPQQESAAEVRPRLTPAQVASNATSRVSRLERCIAQLSRGRQHRVTGFASCAREGTGSDGSPSPGQTGGGLSAILFPSKTTVGKSSGSSQSCPGGRGQIRSGVSRWSEEVGGAQGRSSRSTCGARCRGGSAHHPCRFGCGGESVASFRSGVDSRARHSPCRHFRGRSTNSDSVSCGACGDQEPLRHDGHFDRGSRFRSSEKPARSFCSVLTTEDDNVQQLLLGGLRGVRVSASSQCCVKHCTARYGLRGVRVGEACHPGPSSVAKFPEVNPAD